MVRKYGTLAAVTGVVGFILLFVFFFMLGQRRLQIFEQQGQIGSLVIARADIAAGTILTEDLVSDQHFLQANHPDSAYQSINDVVGKTVIAPLYQGQLILAGNLGHAGELVPSTLIPAGNVAYALPIGPDQAVGGFIMGGDRIDILSTSEGGTEVILSDVVVLGVAGRFPFGPATQDDELDPGETTRYSSGSVTSAQYGPGIEAKILILSLTRDQAVQLADAKERTVVSVSLHSTK